jgi:hypothetical protein
VIRATWASGLVCHLRRVVICYSPAYTAAVLQRVSTLHDQLALASVPPAAPNLDEVAPEPRDEQWAQVNVSVPAGSTGEIHVPISTPHSSSPSAAGTIYESGVVVWHDGVFLIGRAAGVRKAEVRGQFVVFETLSGEYRFGSSA